MRAAAHPLQEHLLEDSPMVAPNRCFGLKVSAMVGAVLLVGAGIFFVMPDVLMRDQKKPTKGPFISKQVYAPEEDEKKPAKGFPALQQFQALGQKRPTNNMSAKDDKKPTRGSLTLQEVMARHPRPDNIHELNAFFELLPAHDDHVLVFNHIAPHVKLMFNTFLDHFGTTAPHWQTRERKRRHLIDDVAEFDYRLGVFTETLRKIIKQNAFEAKHNPKPNRAVFGVTKFADWTWPEFETMLNARRSPQNTTYPAEPLDTAQAPCNKNWAAEHRDLFVPRQQGTCGSCYAHAAAEELRAMAYINAGFDPGLLSVQYIIDCKGDGCDGGDASNVMDWVRQQGGIPSKVDYGPYHNEAETCKRGIPFAVTTSGAGRHRAEDDTARTICNEGPTSMGVRANDNFQSYMHGVLSHYSCPAGSNNHDTQAVGVLQSQGAWLIRNSWGADWGVDPVTLSSSGSRRGFILLEYGYNTCGVEQLNGIPQNVVKANGCTGGGECSSPTPAPPSPPAPPPSGNLCQNTCKYAYDGTCDDGSTGVCGYGTDCHDCGPRTPTQGCSDTCRYSHDGTCDEPLLCQLGTDCTDCGEPGINPCASCQSAHLGSGEVCVEASDGTCSTPDDQYYCKDSHGSPRVASCEANANPCASCQSSHLRSGEVCVESSDGTCSTPDDQYYCKDSHGSVRVASCEANPCASCQSSHLRSGEVCVESSDGTCSTPDDQYYCEDSSGRGGVASC